MKTKKLSLIILMITAVFLWTCTKELDTIDPKPEVEDTEMAFKKGGSKSSKKKIKFLQGNIIYNPVQAQSWCKCPSSTLQGPWFKGSGRITHLGITLSEVTSCVVPNASMTELYVKSSCVTMVAANGDEIYLEQDPYTLKLQPDTKSFMGISKAKILGGTGRYKNASGKILARVTQDINNQVTSTISGMVRY